MPTKDLRDKNYGIPSCELDGLLHCTEPSEELVSPIQQTCLLDAYRRSEKSEGSPYVLKKHPILEKIHDLTGIPESILEKHWRTVGDVVAFSYDLSEDDREYLPTVLKLFQNKISSLGNSYRDALASSFKRAITGAKKNGVSPPSVKTPPVGINPEALVYWRAVLKSQKKKINQFSANEEKWAAAIILFKSICGKKGVAPFLPNGTVKDNHKSPIPALLSSYVEPCIKAVEEMEKFLSGKNITGKKVPKKFKLGSIDKEGTVSIVNATKTWKLLKGETAASVIVYMMPKFGLKKTDTKGTYRKKCGTKAYILLSYGKRTDKTLKVTIQIKVGKKTVKSIENLKKSMEAFFRPWISKGFKATGGTDSYEESPESNETLIKEYYSVNNSEEAAKLINTLSVPALVNTGNEDFQISLAKYLLEVANRFDLTPPALLEKFITDSDFRDFAREEYGNIIPSEDETEGVPEGKITK